MPAVAEVVAALAAAAGAVAAAAAAAADLSVGPQLTSGAAAAATATGGEGGEEGGKGAAKAARSNAWQQFEVWWAGWCVCGGGVCCGVWVGVSKMFSSACISQFAHCFTLFSGTASYVVEYMS